MAVTRMRAALVTLMVVSCGGADVKRMFVYGLGYVGAGVALRVVENGGSCVGTCREEEKAAWLAERGITCFRFDDDQAAVVEKEMLKEIGRATHMLVTVPPNDIGVDRVIGQHLEYIRWAYDKGDLEWIGYLSSTGRKGLRKDRRHF